MNLDSELQGIVRENEGDLLSFARKIYEHGYRQGLASRPAGAEPPPIPAPAETPPISGKPVPLFPTRAPAAAGHHQRILPARLLPRRFFYIALPTGNTPEARGLHLRYARETVVKHLQHNDGR
jgi:hypothetical protein